MSGGSGLIIGASDTWPCTWIAAQLSNTLFRTRFVDILSNADNLATSKLSDHPFQRRNGTDSSTLEAL